MRPLFVKISTFALALAIGGLPVVPPQHVHDEAGPGNQHHLVVHRHAPAHRIAPPLEGRPSLEDADPVETIQEVFIAPSPVTIAAPAVQVLATVEFCETVCRLLPFDRIEPVIHSPPGSPSALRAPPPSIQA